LKLEAGALLLEGGSELKSDADVRGSRIPDLRGYAIHMWKLNEQEPTRHLERSGSQSGGAACRGR